MTVVSTPGAVLIGCAASVLGLLFMWLRVPVAAFFRDAGRRWGSRNIASQTPGLVFAVGAGFFAVGAFIAVGTLVGWLHPR